MLVCTDVAARGLDIPNVNNVIHYQCPFNAEIYVHRCGRTARIGREGEALNLLAPEDEKSFKTILSVLKRNPEDVKLLDVSYSQLEFLKPMVKSAQKLELSTYRATMDQKDASWMLK